METMFIPETFMIDLSTTLQPLDSSSNNKTQPLAGSPVVMEMLTPLFWADRPCQTESSQAGSVYETDFGVQRSNVKVTVTSLNTVFVITQEFIR